MELVQILEIKNCPHHKTIRILNNYDLPSLSQSEGRSSLNRHKIQQRDYLKIIILSRILGLILGPGDKQSIYGTFFGRCVKYHSDLILLDH
jgi:hypothetical protein